MIEINQGEKRVIGIKVIAEDKQPFTILSANYALYPDNVCKPSTLEDSGTAQINGGEITAVVSPKNKGQYILEFDYEIEIETLKSKVSIQVN